MTLADPVQREEDLHVLIAFASKLIGKELATPNESRRSESLVSKYGIPPVDHDSTNKRTLPILDAMASLSVFEERGQAVAVALQMDRDAKTIHLTVAENRVGRVEPCVVAQIDAIWTILQFLSTEYCKLRSLSRRMEDPHEWGDQSSELPITPQLSAAREELVRLVYTFCWKKLNIRVEKWWPCLDSMSMKITSFLYIEGGEDPSGLMNKFLGVVVMLRMALPIVKNPPDKSFPISLWNVFSARMDTAIEKAADILSDDVQCEAWGKRFRGEIHRTYFPSSYTFDSDLPSKANMTSRFAELSRNSPHCTAISRS